MEAHIYSVKPESQAGNICVKFIMTKPERQNQKKISKGSWASPAREFRHFARNSAEGLGSRKERCWHYISMAMHTKSCCIFPLKVAATLFAGSRKSTVGTQ